MIRRFKVIDWLVVGGLIVFAFVAGQIYALLAVIVLLLYLILRYMSGAFKAKTVNETPEDADADTFIVDDSHEHDVDVFTVIDLDRDIDKRPAKGRFCWYSRFDLSIGRADFQYKCEGTKVFFRLLSRINEGESAGFNKEWEVRDGVVLESDMRTRFASKEFKFGNIDREIAVLKKQVEWQELQPEQFRGFKYFLIKRCLPDDEARRYLRQEIERLKMGFARAVPVAAEKYGIEPDDDPKSIRGWKRIAGREGVNNEPFWQELKSGMYGISEVECGSIGRRTVSDIEKLLGDRTDGH